MSCICVTAHLARDRSLPMIAGAMLAPRVTPSISQDHHHAGWFQPKPEVRNW